MVEPLTQLVWYPGHDLLLPDIVRAEGCHLYDSRGRRYTDLESGVWCTPIGHTHPRVLRVIAEQSARIAHAGYCYSNDVVEGAAREILSLLGFEHGRCVFLCSGSESVEFGVRVAQLILERPLLMTMTDSYFGAYGSASGRSEEEWFCFDWMACGTCPDSAGCREGCEHWATIPFERIGGFLFEPGSSSGLVRFPPVKLIRSIASTIREAEGLLLVNEVTTGIGRTGEWFGYQHYDITPDIIAMGKGIGNGYPVSVTAIGPDAADRLGSRPVPYAQSHQNDPLGAAVATEVIRVIREEGLIERARELSRMIIGGLEGIRARTGVIAQIRARGLMIAIELADDAGCTRTSRTYRELVDRGFVLARRPGTNVLRLDPALTIDQEDIESFMTEFEQVLVGE